MDLKNGPIMEDFIRCHESDHPPCPIRHCNPLIQPDQAQVPTLDTKETESKKTKQRKPTWHPLSPEKEGKNHLHDIILIRSKAPLQAFLYILRWKGQTLLLPKFFQPFTGGELTWLTCRPWRPW